MTYNDLNLRKYLEIREVCADKMYTDEQKTKRYVEIIYDKDINEIPLVELGKYLEEIKFLSGELPKYKTKKEYIIKGTKYNLADKISKLTAGQYLDFINISQNDPEAYEKLIACFLVPEGHKYADGYDIEQLYEDILDEMSVVDVQSLSFFLLKHFQTFTNRLSNYTIYQIMMTKEIPLKERLKLSMQIKRGTNLMGSLTT